MESTLHTCLSLEVLERLQFAQLPCEMHTNDTCNQKCEASHDLAFKNNREDSKISYKLDCHSTASFLPVWRKKT